MSAYPQSDGIPNFFDYRDLVREEARRQGVNQDLAEGILMRESKADPRALSPKGAIGLMQLMPSTAARFGVDPHDPLDNIKGGIRYLKFLSNRFNNDPRLIAAGYNAGEAAVEKYGGVPPFEETRAYVQAVAPSAARNGRPSGSAIEGIPDFFAPPAPDTRPPLFDQSMFQAGPRITRRPASERASEFNLAAIRRGTEAQEIARRSALEAATPVGPPDVLAERAASGDIDAMYEQFDVYRKVGDKLGMARMGLLLKQKGWEAGPGEDGWWYVKRPIEDPRHPGRTIYIDPESFRARQAWEQRGEQERRARVLERSQSIYLRSLPPEQRRAAAVEIARREPLTEESRELAGFGPGEKALQVGMEPFLSATGGVLSGIGKEAETIAPLLGYEDYHSALSKAGGDVRSAAEHLRNMGPQGFAPELARGGATALTYAGPGGFARFAVQNYLEARGEGLEHGEAVKRSAALLAGLYAGGKIGAGLEKAVDSAVAQYLARSTGSAAGLEAMSLFTGEPQTWEGIGVRAGLGLVFGQPFRMLRGRGNEAADEAPHTAIPLSSVSESRIAARSIGQAQREALGINTLSRTSSAGTHGEPTPEAAGIPDFFAPPGPLALPPAPVEALEENARFVQGSEGIVDRSQGVRRGYQPGEARPMTDEEIARSQARVSNELVGRLLTHSLFGEVTVSENQAGVPKGKLRVTDRDGNEHLIQNPQTTGNVSAAFSKTRGAAEPERAFASGPPSDEAFANLIREQNRADAALKDLKRLRKLGTLVPETRMREARVALLEAKKRLQDAVHARAGAQAQTQRPRSVSTMAPARREEGATAGREFSSTHVDLPAEVADRVLRFGRLIPDDKLGGDGREEAPHITVKYGLDGDDVEALRRVLADEGPITVRFGKTSVFPASEVAAQRGGEQYDVVKVDVDSEDLQRLNRKISNALPHTDTHPDYQPHVTIAYVKPGLGEEYSGKSFLEGTTVKLNKIAFSDRQGNITEIPLTGRPSSYEGSPLRPQARRAPKDKGLLAAIRHYGGIDPESAGGRDIARYMSQPEAGTTGLIVSKARGGRSAEDMLTTLRADGWFPSEREDQRLASYDRNERSAGDILLDAMRQEATTGRQLRPADYDYSDDIEREAALHGAGLDFVEPEDARRLYNKALKNPTWVSLFERVMHDTREPSKDDVDQFRRASKLFGVSDQTVERIIEAGEYGRSPEAVEFATGEETHAGAPEGQSTRTREIRARAAGERPEDVEETEARGEPSTPGLTITEYDRVVQLKKSLDERQISVDDYLRQQGLFGSELNPAQQGLLRELDQSKTRPGVSAQQQSLFEIKERERAYRDEIKQQISKETRKLLNQTNVGLPIELLSLYTKLGASYIREGVADVAEFARRIREHLGDVEFGELRKRMSISRLFKMSQDAVEAERAAARMVSQPQSEAVAEPAASEVSPRQPDESSARTQKQRNDAYLKAVIDELGRQRKTRKQANRQPSVVGVFKEQIGVLYSEGQAQGLSGNSLTEFVRRRLIDVVGAGTEFSEATPARKLQAYKRLESAAVERWIDWFASEQKKQEMADHVMANRQRVHDELHRRVITNSLPPDQQNLILRRAEGFREGVNRKLSRDTQNRLFSGFLSRVSVMARSYGAAGGELVNRLTDGDLARSQIIGLGAKWINRTNETYGEIKNPFEIQRTNEAVVAALQDRANAERYLDTDAKRDVYHQAAEMLDYFKGELRRRGYNVRGDYFTHIQDVDVIDQIFGDVKDPRLERARSLNQFITEKSPFLKHREGADFKIREDVPAVLWNYLRSVSKELAYRDAVDYYYTRFQHDIPAALQRNSLARAVQTVRNSLNPDVGAGLAFKTSNYIRGQLYRAFLGYNIKAALTNYTQVEFAKLRWMPEANALRKKVSRSRAVITGPLADAIDLASRETPRYLDLFRGDQPTKEEGRFEALFNRYDFFQRSEGRNWAQTELGSILNSVVKRSDWRAAVKRNGGDRLKAANEILSNKSAFDAAVREAAVTSAHTQVAANPAMRGEIYDKPAARLLLMFTAFKARQLQVLGQVLGRQRGVNGARAQAVLQRGLTGDATPIEVLREVELTRRSVEAMLDAAAKHKEDLGVPTPLVRQYADYLKGQERDLNDVIRQIEPMGGGGARRYALTAKYIATVAAISTVNAFLWHRIEEAFSDREQSDQERARSLQRLTTRIVLDVSPVPMYGFNPAEATKTPVVPDWSHIYEHGEFSERGAAKDIFTTGVRLIPYAGVVDRATGNRVSRTLANVIAPPAERPEQIAPLKLPSPPRLPKLPSAP